MWSLCSCPEIGESKTFNICTVSYYVSTCTVCCVMLVPWDASLRHVTTWESPTEDRQWQNVPQGQKNSKRGSSPGMGSVAELKPLLLIHAAQNCSTSAKEISHYMASAEGCSPLSAPNHREDLMHAKAVARMCAEREHSEGLGLLIFKWDSSLYKDFLCFDVQSLQT